ncbi:MAG: tRNA (N(6)-L-threonylcarbamoyladenosine(37)-C(2))-methylthiotransferase [Nanobdellota archaeon]
MRLVVEMVRVYIKTYGCAHNQADSEAMADLLSQEGYNIAGLPPFTGQDKQSLLYDMNSSDVVIINTCTVKNPSESKFFSLLQNVSVPVIIAGCIPQSEPSAHQIASYSAIGVDQINTIVEVVNKTLQGEVIHKLSRLKKPPERHKVSSIRNNLITAIIPLSQGCVGNCSYCKTKSARGSLKSHSKESILSHITSALDNGCKELWLVSEDTGAYGLDSNTTLPSLLEDISSAVFAMKGIKIRLGMINPHFAHRYRHELVSFLKKDFVYNFIHIPIQSGSNAVLKEMNRPYTREQCLEVCSFFKEEIPDITISTDIICGFPTETEDDFSQTMNLVSSISFPIINISKFYPRPKTPASKRPLLPTSIPKQRSSQLTSWFSKQQPNKSYTNTLVSTVITDYSPRFNTLLGRTDNYRQVIISLPFDIPVTASLFNKLSGTSCGVFISSVSRDDLRGKMNLSVSLH